MRMVMSLTAICAAGWFIGQEARGAGRLDWVPFLWGSTIAERSVLELRCGPLDDRARGECEAGLLARFDSGRADADSILRFHCTRVENVWLRQPSPPPPAPCSEQFGGWIPG
jgi:hypothetical protein